jgi:hypothetical protein
MPVVTLSRVVVGGRGSAPVPAKVTTSGSAILAVCHGSPVIVPDPKLLWDLPDAAAIRYDGSVASLRTTLIGLASTRIETLVAMSAVALEYADSSGWTEAAQRLLAKIQRLAGAHAQ